MWMTHARHNEECRNDGMPPVLRRGTVSPGRRQKQFHYTVTKMAGEGWTMARNQQVLCVVWKLEELIKEGSAPITKCCWQQARLRGTLRREVVRQWWREDRLFCSKWLIIKKRCIIMYYYGYLQIKVALKNDHHQRNV